MDYDDRKLQYRPLYSLNNSSDASVERLHFHLHLHSHTFKTQHSIFSYFLRDCFAAAAPRGPNISKDGPRASEK